MWYDTIHNMMSVCLICAQVKKRFEKEWKEAEKAIQQTERIQQDPNTTKADVEKVHTHTHLSTPNFTHDECYMLCICCVLRSNSRRWVAHTQQTLVRRTTLYSSRNTTTNNTTSITQRFPPCLTWVCIYMTRVYIIGLLTPPTACQSQKLQNMEERRIRMLADGYVQFSETEKKLLPNINKCLDAISTAGRNINEKQVCVCVCSSYPLMCVMTVCVWLGHSRAHRSV